jgi:hypothetical protein
LANLQKKREREREAKKQRKIWASICLLLYRN